MILNKALTKVVASLFFMLILFVRPVMAKPAQLKRIKLENKPYGVRIKLTAKVPYKVVHFDRREILVAFKNMDANGMSRPTGSGLPKIKDVRVSQKKRGVVSLIISLQEDVASVSSVWIPIGNTLLVKPVFKKTFAAKRKKAVSPKAGPTFAAPDESLKPKSDLEGTSEKPEEIIDEPVISESYEEPDENGYKLLDRSFDERFSGSTEDLFLELRSDACDGDQTEIKKAVVMCKQGLWARAFEIFDDFVDNDTLSKRCLENLYALRAYSFFKDNENGTGSDYLEAADYFYEFISYFPDSIYAPYAITCLGKIHAGLKDYAQAEGYFKIILKVYRDYPGTPEALFELGKIYSEKKDTRLAIAMLRKVVTQFPKGKFIGIAKLALGKSLFHQNDFYAAIKVLADVIKNSPRLLYKEPELLQFLGNAYYHTNQSEKARDLLSKVYNLFPLIEGRDTLLTRIGDTFVENKKTDKAIKIFKLVVKKYPGTDGFVISSMRLAEFLELSEEKMKLYNMVIEDYPDNPLSRLALMRLAILFHKDGDYEKSVATVKQLLATEPRALKNDAINLLQDSSEFIFKKQLASNEYTALLTRFENDKKFLDPAENPNLFLLVGTAYLKAHLYETAIEQLMKSYKRIGKNKRPAELIYSLGVAMDETERDDEAYNMFKTYVKYFSTKNDIADVYTRIGNILLKKKKFNDSVLNFEKAYKKTGTTIKKAVILVDKSKGYRGLKNYKSAVNSLIKAVNMLASEPEDAYETLALAHRHLGENYMDLQNWIKAADAFGMAVKFADMEKPSEELYFMLGEAFQKGNKYKDAEKAYQNVVEKGDSFWSSMAKERLRAMRLDKRLENT